MSIPKKSETFTPFFVADRQASLRILSGLDIPDGKRIGIMTHANTFRPFKDALSKFPCFDQNNCGVVDGPCPYDGDITLCEKGTRLRDNRVIICDSGVFQRKGCKIEYSDLFDEYERMGVDYGIIIDVLKDKGATLISAKKAMDEYLKKPRPFNLIGVAQGTTPEEYLDCYKRLQDLNYKNIAIGGMLRRKEKSARYVAVRNESVLKEILSTIRDYDSNGWLFALGCYSPKRHSTFLQYSIFGSDYKGWIFQYSGSSPKRGNKKSQKKRFREVRSFIEEQVLSRSQTYRIGPKLLIIPCSKRKIEADKPIQAIQLYDGPLYHIIRKYVHDFSNADGMDIAILSAKYGLINPMKRISPYDQRMDKRTAIELQKSCDRNLQKMHAKKGYKQITVNLGNDYLLAMEDALGSLEGVDIEFIGGRMGERISKVKEWILS